MSIRYLSVCSGIEAASVAWHPLGWTPVAFAEIEKFPSQVLAHHYGSNLPGQPLSHNAPPNLGDITKFKEWPDLGTVDLLVGGTPCQSFSVAGLRAGLADPRGNLALTYLAIADRYRPRILLWENVPGVLSSNGGRDFGSILGGMVELGYGVAYRVLDAQYVRVDGLERAVPQRRRRVFVVGYIGDWRRAAAVLFDAASLRGDPPPRRQTREAVAGTLSASTGGSDENDAVNGRQTAVHVDEIARCVTAGYSQRIDAETENFVASHSTEAPPPLTSNPYGDHESREGLLVAHSLRASGYDASENGTGRGTPIVPVDLANAIIGDGVSGTLERAQSKGNRGQAIAFAIQERAVSENAAAGPDGIGVKEGSAYILEARQVPQAIAFDTTQITSPTNRNKPEAGGTGHPLAAQGHPPAIAWTARQDDFSPKEVAPPLDRDQGTVAVAFDLRGREGGAMPEGPHDTANLRSPSGGSSRSYVAETWAVRRLTPLECERLQAFPDGYTAVSYRGKPAADGPRYQALGNSMAVNCMRWLGRRIEMVERIP
jgi:DNA (cytosine-5)-methyltransferase 1